MRQRRWLELLKDYDCYILYHTGKANVVAYALSRKSQSKVSNSVPTLDKLTQQFGMIQLDTRPKDRDISINADYSTNADRWDQGSPRK